jgi:hypothetical protein
MCGYVQLELTAAAMRHVEQTGKRVERGLQLTETKLVGGCFQTTAAAAVSAVLKKVTGTMLLTNK